MGVFSCHFPNPAIVVENKLFPAALLPLGSLKGGRGGGVHWKKGREAKMP